MATKKKAASGGKRNLPAAPGRASTALAIPSSGPMPAGITVARRVTMPAIALKTEGQEKFFHIVDAMRVSQRRDEKSDKPPATICTVGDVLTGEMMVFIVPTVVKSNLERDYPDEGYVGRTFRIRNIGKKAGKSYNYHDFAIDEVTVDTEALKAATAAQAHA